MIDRQYYLYILTNRYNTVLYTGVTNDLVRRVYEHRLASTGGFASRHRAGKLVYYETFEDPESANEREKQIKAGPRRNKVNLIESVNPDWKDLYEDIV